MYNYLGVIRKSTAIDHCISCNFFDDSNQNLIISKNNRLEFYSLINETLSPNKFINIYGKIKILLNVPANDPNNKSKENIFVLSSDLDFCLFTFNKKNNSIDALIKGNIKEDLGQIQDNILFTLDSNKNYILINAYKNIFRIICVNNELRLNEKFKDYMIRFQYDEIFFITGFPNKFSDEKDNNDDKNILTFALVKSELSEDNDMNFFEHFSEDNNVGNNNIKIKKDFYLETFQIKLEPESFGLQPFLYKPNITHKSLNVNSTRRKYLNKKNTSEKIPDYNIKKETSKNETNEENKNLIVSYNQDKLYGSVFHWEIGLKENNEIHLMITNSHGFIYVFLKKNFIVFKHNQNSKIFDYYLYEYSSCILNVSSIIIENLKFVNYTIVDEALQHYLLIDEKGNLFSFMYKYEDAYTPCRYQLIQSINYTSCMALFHKNILFIGSKLCNSQLYKINFDNKITLELLQEYESLSPITDFTLINNSKEENGIDILTISGVDNFCSIKNIKKGSSVLFSGDIEIKNIINVFEIFIDNKYSFVISTLMNSFIIDYDKKNISLHNSINFNKEIINFAVNLTNNFILFVTNLSIIIYRIEKSKEIIIENYKFNNSKPLIIKHNKKCNSLFIYANDKKLYRYLINKENGKIINTEIILINVDISAFDVCEYFLLFTTWDSRNLNIFSFDKKNNLLYDIDSLLDYEQISSIQIIKKSKSCLYIFLSLSTGKLIFIKFEKSNENKINKDNFILKRKYNLCLENFKIKKIKLNNQKCLFINSISSSLIHFNNSNDNLVISNINVNFCKNLIVLNNEKNNYLFIFDNKISFGSFLNQQSQNIHPLSQGKSVNKISIVSIENNFYNKENKSNKLILTLQEIKTEKNIIKTAFVISDINLKQISKYNFEYDNEQSFTFTEIFFKNNLNKYYVIGTGISEDGKTEPTIGHLYLLEINLSTGFSIKKLQELEITGGVYKIASCGHILYVGIKNTLNIFSVNKNSHENFYEFKSLKKFSDFTSINEIYILPNSNDNKNIHEILICDLYKTLALFNYDVENDKLNEVCRDYNLSWIFGLIECRKNFFYYSDINDNIITLEKVNHSKDNKEKYKLEHKAYFNYGERINSLMSTEINNKDLAMLAINKEIKNENQNLNDINSNVNVVYFATLEGSVGYIIQLNKETFEYLYKLQEVLVKKIFNNGGFNYKRWRSYKDGFIYKDAKGYVEGEIIKEFLNYDDDFKKIIMKEMNYPWKKELQEVVHIIEILSKFC